MIPPLDNTSSISVGNGLRSKQTYPGQQPADIPKGDAIVLNH